MRNQNQLPSQASGNLTLNPFMMAKTGQLSLMDTVYCEPVEPESPVVLPDIVPPTDRTA
jgi:hypothetical protein